MKALIGTAFLALASMAWAAQPVEVKGLRLAFPQPGKAQIQIDFPNEADVSVVENPALKQILIEAGGAVLPATLTRVLDAASKDSPVLQVTPYNSGSKEKPRIKLVVQLRETAEFNANQIGDRYLVDIFRAKAKPRVALKPLPPPPPAKPSGLRREAWTESDQVETTAAASEKSIAMARQLMQTLNAPPERRTYTGKSVDFEAADTDVHDVFRLVGAASGLNVVTNNDVKGKVTISVRDLPWDQLLDIVLQQNNLKASAVGNVVRIFTMQLYAQEERQKRELLLAQQANEPVIMGIIPLSYAKAEDVRRIIQTMLASSSSSGGAGAGGGAGGGGGGGGGGGRGGDVATALMQMDADLAQAFVRGRIEVDQRSNSLVVTNTELVVERIKKIVKELDAPTPQVLIEAKIVSADESFSRNLGVRWQGRVTGEVGRSGAGIMFNEAASQIVPRGGGVNFSLAGSTAGDESGAAGAAGFQLGAGRNASLQLALQLGELNSQTKIMASPRLVVNNKQKAVISDGQRIALLAPAPNGTFSVTYQDASLSLDVTPQVTNAGSVLMDLNIKNDAPVGDGGNIATKSIQTQVLVESGSTLVLGGVYQMTLSKRESGLPLLKEIPILGSLFKAEGVSQSKTELMIFITPRILDTGAQGISGQL